MRKLLSIVTLIILTAPYVNAAPVPDTGQTKCYDNSAETPCPQPGEPFYGQDGNYAIDLQSYTKLGLGGVELPYNATDWLMVRDNVTGLIWEVKHSEDNLQNYADPNDSDNTYTWYDSNPATNGGDSGTPGSGTDSEDFINDLNAATYGGYDDWRLPTAKELSFLIDMSSEFPAPLINTNYFPDMGDPLDALFWSSNSFVNNPAKAWTTGAYWVYAQSKANSFYVRAVRLENTDNVFIDNSDGTVTDTSTGLMWQQITAPGSYTWETALAYCENLNFAGYSDWRLPNRNELLSIVDYNDYFSPTINTIYFPDTIAGNYWSSTSANGQTALKALLSSEFTCGLPSDKTYTNYVRAVRSNHCELDSDGDGWVDCSDPCPYDPYNDADGDALCGDADNCPFEGNPDQGDRDLDSKGNACDICPIDPDPNCGFEPCSVIVEITSCTPSGPQAFTDTDCDGYVDRDDVFWCTNGSVRGDNCPIVPNPDQTDSDGDGSGDVCEDSDGDFIFDTDDNCPSESNPDQLDVDGDGAGNVCDNCPDIQNPQQEDFDLDGIGDVCDSEMGCFIRRTDSSTGFRFHTEETSRTLAAACEIIDWYEERRGCGIDTTCSRPYSSDYCGYIVHYNGGFMDSFDVYRTYVYTNGTITDYFFVSEVTSYYTWDVFCYDSDDDGILDDGDLSEVVGDSYCASGETLDCDDNCKDVPNPDQADADGDGIGDACDDMAAPNILSVTTNQGPEQTSIALDNGTSFCDGSQNALWTSQDPDYPGDGLGFASRMGVEHTYFSYKLTTDVIWQPEVETLLYNNPGFYGMWSWVNPVPIIGSDGDYDIRLAAEDGVGNRSEVTYQITIDTTDTDGDDVPDCIDNCPSVCNPIQQDADEDGLGDLCDGDPGCTEGGCTPCEELCVEYNSNAKPPAMPGRIEKAML